MSYHDLYWRPKDGSWNGPTRSAAREAVPGAEARRRGGRAGPRREAGRRPGSGRRQAAPHRSGARATRFRAGRLRVRRLERRAQHPADDHTKSCSTRRSAARRTSSSTGSASRCPMPARGRGSETCCGSPCGRGRATSRRRSCAPGAIATIRSSSTSRSTRITSRSPARTRGATKSSRIRRPTGGASSRRCSRRCRRARAFYQKQMAHHLLPHMGRDWLAGLTHAFLIRDPRAMLASLEKLGIRRSRPPGCRSRSKSSSTCCETTGRPPPVVDSADLLRDPRACCGALCDALGVPFSERMLWWPPGRRDTDGIWAQYWYDRVERSTGFETAACATRWHRCPRSSARSRRIAGRCTRDLADHRLRPEDRPCCRNSTNATAT